MQVNGAGRQCVVGLNIRIIGRVTLLHAEACDVDAVV
jgi:hypothetical protein